MIYTSFDQWEQVNFPKKDLDIQKDLDVIIEQTTKSFRALIVQLQNQTNAPTNIDTVSR